MQVRIQKRGRLLVMMASPLLTLAWGGVGWGSINNPRVTFFLDVLNKQPRFTAVNGACEGGSDHGAPCVLSTGLKGNGSPCSAGTTACVAFDWANGPDSSGACTTTSTGVVNCPPTSDSGLFDGGKFNPSASNPTANPSPPPYIGTDLTIVAHDFGVDPLGISTLTAGSCVSMTDPTTGSVKPCASNADCPPGEKCVTCGTGDPTVYTGAGSEKNGDFLNGDTYGTSTVPNKDDISNVYAIAHQDPAPTRFGSTDTNEIFAGFERVINNGDSHMDLEFLQAKVTLVPSSGNAAAAFPCAGNFNGRRAEGDLLLSADFTTGGTFGTTVARAWVCGGGARKCLGGTADGASCTVATESSICLNGGRCIVCDPQTVAKGVTAPHYAPLAGTFCAGGSNDGESCTTNSDCPGAGVCKAVGLVCPGGTTAPVPCPASNICPGGGSCRSPLRFVVNDTSSKSCGGWACRTPSGTQALFCVGGSKPDTPCKTNTDCGSGTCQTRLLTNEFFEAGIDLAAVGFKGCISTFLPHTRSSQTFSATLKDFAVLQFNTCFPAVRVTKQCDQAHSGVNSAGTGFDIAFTGQVCNTGNVDITIDSLTDAPAATFDSTSECKAGFTLTAPVSPATENCCSYSGHYSVNPQSGTCPGCSSTDQVTVTAHSIAGNVSASSDEVNCTVPCTPGISVTKSCDTTKTKVNAAGTGVDVFFTGNVCNTGNLALSGITVTDVPTATFDTPACSSLAPGTCCTTPFSGHYSSTVCSNSDTVTASATSALTCDTPSNTAGTTCTVTPAPGISVTKTCTDSLAPDPTNPGTNHLTEHVTFNGTVCNTGDVQLTGVTVSDSSGATITSNCGTLDKTVCCNYSGDYFPTNPNVCKPTDTATASGSGICNTHPMNTGSACCAICGLTCP